MPLEQGTFKIVPSLLTPSGPPRPPMTSKQAKKAHKQRDVLPKMSREQRRQWEKEEIAKNNADLDKARAAKKAKLGREKKLEKEKLAREERKKAGIPEKSRWVRPSQPTIAGFARFIREDSASTTSATVNGDDTAEDEPAPEARIGDEAEAPLSPKQNIKIEQPLQRALNEDDVEDDEYGDFPELSQSDLPNILKDGLNGFGREDFLYPERKCTLEKSDGYRRNDVHEFSSSLDLACMAATQLIVEAEEAERRSSPATAGFVPASSARALHSNSASRKDTNSSVGRLQPSGDIPVALMTNDNAPSQSLRPVAADKKARSFAMKSKIAELPAHASKKPQLPCIYPTDTTTETRRAASTMLPPTRKRPLQEANTNKMMAPPCRPYKRYIDPGSKIRHPPPEKWLPPSSAVAFLERNMDDFFPSPSQTVRELLLEIDEYDMPSNTQIAREIDGSEDDENDIGPSQELPLLPSLTVLPLQGELGLFSTQDFVLSSQDLREIDTPGKVSTTFTRSRPEEMPESCFLNGIKRSKHMSRTQKQIYKSKPSIPPQVSVNSTPTIHNLAFHSLETMAPHHQPQPPPLPSPHQKLQSPEPITSIPPSPHKPPTCPPSQPKPRTKRPFFEEKEEDLLKAAIDESLREAQLQKAAAGKPARVPRHTRSRQQTTQRWNASPFSAIVKSSPPSKKQHRTLSRIASAQSDYGEFDLGADESEFLLAMLDKVEHQ